MADHRAEDIVTTIVTQLTGLATTGSRVFRDREYELSEAELPALLVYMVSDNPRQPSILAAPGLLDCELRLIVEAVVKSSAAQVDTTLNQIRYEVSQALHDDVTQGLTYVMHTVEGMAVPELQPDVDQMVGRLRMDWMVLYRRSRGQSAPAFSGAEIVVSGDEIEVTFSDSLTSGSATAGFTWSGGTILSGSYSGTVLTLVIAPYIDGEPGGTLTYSGGTLAGAGGAVADFASEAVTNNSGFAGTWSAVGNSASFPGGTTTVTRMGSDKLNSLDLVIIDDVSDAVRLSRYTDPNWGNVGSTYSVSSLTFPGLCVLPNGTVVIFKSNSTAGLIALTHNGSSFAQVGNQLNVTGSNQGIALVALSTGNFLLFNSQSDTGQEYSFDGTNFAAVGSSFSLGSVNGVIEGDALTSTLVALVDAATANVVLFEKSGGVWAAASGGTYSVTTALGVSTTRPSVCALNGVDIVVGGESGKIQALRWSGSALSPIGSLYTVPNSSSTGTTSLVHMGSNQVAFMRASTSNSFLRRLAWA